MTLRTTEIEDTETKEAVQAYLMLRSAESYLDYARRRVDKLTDEQIEKTIAWLRDKGEYTIRL